jgi:hypothetical protein
VILYIGGHAMFTGASFLSKKVDLYHALRNGCRRWPPAANCAQVISVSGQPDDTLGASVTRPLRVVLAERGRRQEECFTWYEVQPLDASPMLAWFAAEAT